MKIIICDITGRTINYDVALSDALYKVKGADDSIEFWSAGFTESYDFKTHNFFSLVPSKYRNIAHPVTKIMKAFEAIFAYLWIAVSMMLRHVDVFHMQWLPFISLGTKGAGVDMFFIKVMRKVSPRTKFVFTIHNMCPHAMREEERPVYNPTFIKALQLFDQYVVHTERTKQDVIQTFGLDGALVNVVYHGIFVPKDYTFSPVELDKDNMKLIMYGFQNPYKGTDLFVKGLACLDEDTKKKVSVKICGDISEAYLEECKAANRCVNIEWIPKFLPDKELYDLINESDAIILPYRRISQSGVLLLALSTKRIIITSDLPTFKETLSGFPDEVFFKNDNPQDFSRVIEAYMNGNVDCARIYDAIEKLNMKYSWEKSAYDTLEVYKK